MNTDGKDKQVRILQSLNRIHSSVGVNLELSTVARILVEELVEIVGCTGCAILFIDGKQVHIMAEYGFSKLFKDQEFNADMPAIKYIRDTQRCIFTGDIANSPASSCVPAGCNMKSLICSPVAVKDKVVGIIHLDSLEKDAFDEEDKRFVEQLADAISIAMERALEHSKVKNLSVEDGLTGCFNRRKLDEDIDAEIIRARRYQKVFSVLMVDIDWFKKYNDFHGHGKGDELLKGLVNLFGQRLRAADTVYRYGGEEFFILLPETDKAQAFTVAEKLREILARTSFEGERESQPEGKVTMSIGVATYPWDGNNRDELLKAADTELYRAKKGGRNRVCCFDESSAEKDKEDRKVTCQYRKERS
jgi:diguanylate cyclase (GGDEF)-like protein